MHSRRCKTNDDDRRCWDSKIDQEFDVGWDYVEKNAERCRFKQIDTKKTDANRNKLMQLNEEEKKQLKRHSKIQDSAVLPADHTAFDFWSDKPHKKTLF